MIPFLTCVIFNRSIRLDGTPVSSPAATEAAAAPVGTGASTSWSVQVGAFRSRQQADGIQKQLAEAGFPVSQSAVAAVPGARGRSALARRGAAAGRARPRPGAGHDLRHCQLRR